MFRIADKLVKTVSPSKLDPMGLGQTYWKFWRGVMKNPGDLMSRNIQLASEQLKLLTYGVRKAVGQEAEEVIAPEKGDRRFTNPAIDSAELPTIVFNTKATIKLIGLTRDKNIQCRANGLEFTKR